MIEESGYGFGNHSLHFKKPEDGGYYLSFELPSYRSIKFDDGSPTPERVKFRNDYSYDP